MTEEAKAKGHCNSPEVESLGQRIRDDHVNEKRQTGGDRQKGQGRGEMLYRSSKNKAGIE
jgi:hypothetical protein